MFRTALTALVAAACLLAPAPCRAALSPHAQSVLRDSLANPGRYSDAQLEDGLLSVPEIIKKYGYPSEVHSLETEDGYILEMHRIPHGRGNGAGADAITKPVVFLMHGLMSSAADYIITGPEKAMGYILADAGYDVWLGNARGNYYSRKHTSRNPDSRFSNFWDFSWEEIGRFDLAAMVDYALQTSGQKNVHYVGHSQGATAFFVLNSMRPEYNEKFASAHLLAPVAYTEHFPSESLANTASNTNILYGLANLFGINELFPRGEVVTYQDGEYKCIVSAVLSFLCESLVPVFEAVDNPVLVGHFPAGSALKQVAHYGQNVDSMRFQRWDFGAAQNSANYGSATAPTYDLSRVTAKVVLHYSLADALVGEEDVFAAAAVIPNCEVRKVERSDFNHFDFGWAEDAKDLVYNFIVEHIETIQSIM